MMNEVIMIVPFAVGGNVRILGRNPSAEYAAA